MLQLPREIVQFIISRLADSSILALRQVNIELHAVIDIYAIIRDNMVDMNNVHVSDLHIYLWEFYRHITTETLTLPIDTNVLIGRASTNMPTRSHTFTNRVGYITCASVKHRYLPVQFSIVLDDNVIGNYFICIRVGEIRTLIRYSMLVHKDVSFDRDNWYQISFIEIEYLRIKIFIEKYFIELHTLFTR